MNTPHTPTPSTWPADTLFGVHIPMAQVFGLVGEAIGNDRAQLRYPYRADLTNSRGDVHGGVITMLFDSALACATRAHDPAGYGVITVDLAVHFLQACNGDITVKAQCDRRGRSLSFARGEAFNAQGQLLATATGTFKLVLRT